MDFILAVTFLVLYYVRPHEWMDSMASLQPITKVLALGLLVVIFQAGRGAQWRPHRMLGEFLATPTDWAILAFTCWVLYAAADSRATWASYYPLLAYYVLVAHAVSTPRRMETFLWVWVGLLLFVSTMAVLSEYEIDPFGSAEFSHGMYKGRLSLNLSIFNNPNALGHSVVMILPMIYFLGIWHRVLLLKELSLPLFIMPFWCLLWTQSKGAYISGAAGLLASQTFGRPKWFQAMVIVVAYGIGISALMLLPRMHELESIRDDAGVRGRLLAWNFAWQSFETLPKGLGYGKFTRYVPVYVEGKYRVHKPTHSSYVEVAAELGKGGLLFWLAILYYSLRVLVLAKTESEQEERIRRLLFSLVAIYMVSSWMTNISYRGTFFIQTGVIGAFALHLRRQRAAKAADVSGLVPLARPATEPLLADGVGPYALLSPASVLVGPPAATAAAESSPGHGALPDRWDPEAAAATQGMEEQGVIAFWWARVRRWLRWQRLQALAVDCLLVYLMYRIVIRAWLYFMLDWTGV